MMQVRIGTAGYSYRDWVGDFYPPGTRSGEMLAFYSRQFSVVEINASFYRTPTRALNRPNGGSNPSRVRIYLQDSQVREPSAHFR